jgi:hypothetical protein
MAAANFAMESKPQLMYSLLQQKLSGWCVTELIGWGVAELVGCGVA